VPDTVIIEKVVSLGDDISETDTHTDPPNKLDDFDPPTEFPISVLYT
jgi:hypothetical protein